MSSRWYASRLRAALAEPYVNLLFGARQVGKSTLLRSLLPPDSRAYDLSDPGLRSDWLARPGTILGELRALPRGTTVFIDEAQEVPAAFDAVQHLYDQDRGRWRFVLCGSSARRLRRAGANLLPGRSLLHRLFPLVLAERPASTRPGSNRVLPMPTAGKRTERFPVTALEERLAFGELPGIALAPMARRADLLTAYATLHLEESILREGSVRDWGAFTRFLRLAAAESGAVVNYAAISRESGVSQPTVKAHYQLLEDMFVGISVPAWSGSPRKNLLSSPKFYIFDNGVRLAAAGIPPSVEAIRASAGPAFEAWVAMELWKRAQYLGGRLHHYRTRDGAEVDLVLEHGDALIPVEVKWSEHPAATDARQVRRFMADHPTRATRGFIVCRCARPYEVAEGVLAIPWSDL